MKDLIVQILSRKLVKPSRPTPKHLKHFKLSLFDQLAPPTYINIILYYPVVMGEDSSVKKFRRLEESLSEALTEFYALAGRFNPVDFCIDCNDQGVLYLETQVTGNLSEFLDKGPKVELLNKFVPWNLPPPDQITCPLVAIQANVFDDGGLVLGVRMSHTIGDASTFVTFINEWANASKTSTKANQFLPQFDDLVTIFPVRGCPLIKYPPPPPENFGTVITRRYLFRGSAISALKAKVRTENKCQPTRVLVMMAVIWKAIVGVADAKHGLASDFMIAPAMNLRGRLKVVGAAPVGSNPFGNFWTPFIARLKPGNSEMELHDLVKLLKERIRDVATNITTGGDVDEISLMVTNSFINALEDMLKNNALLCTSWCRFPFYEADFGWGKPFWVSTVPEPFPKVTLLDDRGGHGIEAWVSLYENDLLVFEKDPDISAATLII